MLWEECKVDPCKYGEELNLRSFRVNCDIEENWEPVNCCSHNGEYSSYRQYIVEVRNHVISIVKGNVD